MRIIPLLLLPAVSMACDESGSRVPADSSSAGVVTPAGLSAADSGAPKLLPSDNADESFREFRARALDALARRDTAFLLAMLAPEIKNGFGGDDGIAGFRRAWTIDAPQSALWTTLGRVLRMGGERTSDTSFMAPYVYASWPDSLDAFEYVLVTDSVALVRVRPDTAAEAFGTASHSILRFREWSSVPDRAISADTSWAHVTMPDGRTGWITAGSVYSPVGWRAAFVKRQGRWIMVFFVAGD